MAAWRYLGESLAWKVTDSADGLRAEGYSFSHAAMLTYEFKQPEMTRRLN
jgi:hypothetical protein